MRAFPWVHWPHPLPMVLAQVEGVLPPVPVYISASLRSCAFALEFRGEVGDPDNLPSCFRSEVSREVYQTPQGDGAAVGWPCVQFPFV